MNPTSVKFVFGCRSMAQSPAGLKDSCGAMHKPAISLIPKDEAEAVLKLDEFLPYRLHLCAGHVSTALSRIYGERHKIGMPEWRIIVILGEFGRMTAKEVSLRGQMHKTKVSRAVALLERRQLVMRRANAADLREAFLSLTPEGRSVYDDLAPHALQFASRLIASIDPRDHDVFCRVLTQLTERSGSVADDITGDIAEDIAMTGKAG